MGSGSSCLEPKACASDYLAIVSTSITSIIIFLGVCFLWYKRRTPEVQAKQAFLLVIQAVGSINWLIALLMTKYVSRLNDYSPWVTCYFWQVWIEIPFGYCLVVSCYVARAYRLYYVFVRRRLPRLRSWHVVLLLLVPSISSAAAIQWRNPFKQEKEHHYAYRYCSGSISWWIFIAALDAAYIFMLILSTWFVRNIRFEFNESKELLASVVASLLFLGVWLALLFVGSYTKNSDHFQNMFQSTTAYVLVLLGCAVALCFSFFPVLRPLKGYLCYLKKHKDVDSMGQVLGVQNSGLLHPYISFRFDEPLEDLLRHKQFKQAFQAFADSRMAGENVRFYFEVHELNTISSTNTIARIYMAQHIIETYVEAGSPMEINISHAMRADILDTRDLSNPALFNSAACEAITIIKANLEQDFWQSPQFHKLKDEIDLEVEFAEQLEWMNISSKRDSFSTTENLFDIHGSPMSPIKHGNLSPPMKEALGFARRAALSPDHFGWQSSLRAERNTSQIVTRSAPFGPHVREQTFSHFHPLSTRVGGVEVRNTNQIVTRSAPYGPNFQEQTPARSHPLSARVYEGVQ